MAREARLSVEARLESLPRISEFLERQARAWKISPDALFACQLACEEACSNVIKHAYQGGGGPLEVLLCLEAGDLWMVITDRGRSFDPRRVRPFRPHAPAEEMLKGGLGLFLIERLMDEVGYQAGEEGNRLTLRKRGVLAD